ncbi:10925_t:CDS:2 [Paraglomus brasilianum]|uniref:10925_t:CDS:1 n=1 Tax=Paraglomus brasilianum TaxID=144538 RepID=A0A9N8W9W6_9GLOM|nr:10925_t:CDS:2 [Paraglomus brasilianum]
MLTSTAETFSALWLTEPADVIMTDAETDHWNVESTKSAEGDFDTLIQCWLNERWAPEILHPQEELARVENALIEQDDNYDEVENENQRPRDTIEHIVAQIDIDRTKYILESYADIRREKIEAHARHILKNPEERVKLTSTELDFAEKYVSLLAEYEESSYKRDCPREVKHLLNEGLDGQMDIRRKQLTYPAASRYLRVIAQSNLATIWFYLSTNSMPYFRLIESTADIVEGRCQRVGACSLE